VAPTLVNSHYTQLSPQGTSALTVTFTPGSGEILVVKLATWDSAASLGAPSGGGLTYTSRVVVAPGGFNQWGAIYTAPVLTSPGSMTVSSTPSTSLRGSMLVERWSGAQLAATPITNSNNGIGGAAASTITPSAGTSVLPWVGGDASSVDPATRAYLASAQDGLRDDHVGANGVDYHAYQSSTGTGSQSYGLSAPTGMTWVLAAIEVQASAGSSFVAPPPLTIRQAVKRASIF
jgi:hypothetical protein